MHTHADLMAVPPANTWEMCTHTISTRGAYLEARTLFPKLRITFILSSAYSRAYLLQKHRQLIKISMRLGIPKRLLEQPLNKYSSSPKDWSKFR